MIMKYGYASSLNCDGHDSFVHQGQSLRASEPRGCHHAAASRVGCLLLGLGCHRFAGLRPRREAAWTRPTADCRLLHHPSKLEGRVTLHRPTRIFFYDLVLFVLLSFLGLVVSATRYRILPSSYGTWHVVILNRFAFDILVLVHDMLFCDEIVILRVLSAS